MSFKDAISELKRIDPEEDIQKRIGSSPILLRIGLAIVLFAVIVAGMYWKMVIPQQDKLVAEQNRESELRMKFDHEQSKAANRTAYVEQLEEMQKTFNVMLRQLPNKTDIESLLVDLSQTSVASGLEVKYFKPETEILREFYAEYPIKISVVGQYHQFGQFISGLAALPRIVTLSSIDINDFQNKSQNSDNRGADRRLKMDLVATTYRYLDEED